MRQTGSKREILSIQKNRETLEKMPTAGVVAFICKPSTWEVKPDYEGFKAILSYNKFDWDLGYFRRKKRKSTPTPTHPYTHTHTSTGVEPVVNFLYCSYGAKLDF